MVAPVEPPVAPKPTVPRSARVLGSFGRSLITTGVVVLLFVIFQLWGTNILESRAQGDLRDEFDSTFLAAQTQLAAFDAGVLTPVESGESTPVSAGEFDEEPDVVRTETKPQIVPADTTTSTLPGGFDPEVLAFFFPEDGDAVARMEIPAIGLDKIVVNGVQVVDLRKGPGRYPGTAQVGTEGNVGIAGHRTTYGAPFNRIDELQPGDEIRMTGILGSFTYRVMTPEAAYPDQLPDILDQGNGHIIVPPSATWVLGDFGDNRITLTACNPKYSARERIIVAAELVEAPSVAPVFDPEVVAAYIGEGSGETQLASEFQIPGETQLPAEAEIAAEAQASDQTQVSESARSGVATTAVNRPPTDAATANLDEGLRGERDAIPGAIMWMLVATALWSLGRIVARRLFEERGPRIAVRLVGFIPTAAALWFSFEMIDRALPAG